MAGQVAGIQSKKCCCPTAARWSCEALAARRKVNHSLGETCERGRVNSAPQGRGNDGRLQLWLDHAAR